MQQPKKIPALGRIHPLGCLYSAHKEQFYPALNMFVGEITEEQYDETDIYATDISYSMTNSVSDKIESLDISGEVSLSLMAGMVKVAGSASYINSDRKNTNVSEMSFLYSLITLNQNILSVKRMNIDNDMLNDLGATHVVVGIDWGAKCNISCQYENKTNKSEVEVKGMLEGLVKKMEISLELEVKGKASFTEKDNEEHRKFNFQAKCDISKMDKIPQTFSEAVSLAASLPEAVKTINGGKGVPVNYYLLPLDIVAKACKQQLKKTLVVNEIENDIIQRFSQLVDRTADAKLKLSTMVDGIRQNSNWFTNEQLNNVIGYRNNLDILESKFKEKFRETLEKARNGESSNPSLGDIIDGVMDPKNRNGLPSIESAYQDHFTIVKKTLDIIQILKLPNVKIFGKNDAFEIIFTEMGEQVVLFLSENPLESTELTENIMFFKRVAKDAQENKKAIKFGVVLTSFHPVSHSVPILKRYKDGKVVVEDLLEKEGELMKRCIIRVPKSDIKNIRSGEAKSSQRVPLKIRCPLSYVDDCYMEKVMWEHDVCQGGILYEIDNQVMYCKCGSFKPKDATFRCDDPNHGLDFCKLNEKSKEEIGELKLKEITNILILGESGVGKSTWINAIAKYLIYDTLDKATASDDTSVLIPSKFSFTKADGTTVLISVGNQDDNENKTTGESATQKPISYLFDIDSENQIRLIDTPGIGDSRGIQQDEKNFEMILEHLSYYNKINGICILLKPNSARLGVMLKFCIGELLTHLDKSAANNILFCFTNCRGTFYQPGETLPVLQKLLSTYKNSKVEINQNNRFCFDNESFRMLACVQNGVKFSQPDIDAYSASWDRAVLETANLFRYVCNLKPHNTDDTLNLNSCRKWVVELSKPIAQIQSTIQNNIAKVESKKERLQGIQKHGGNLNDELYTEYDQLKLVPLDRPRTVCKGDGCTRVDTVSFNNNIPYIYKYIIIICHSDWQWTEFGYSAISRPNHMKLPICRKIAK